MQLHKKFPIVTILSLTLPLQAAPITWGPATNVNDLSDVSTSGTLIEAINLGSTTTGTNQTVNGVLFTGSDSLLSSNSANDAFPGDTGDVDYNALLSSFDFGGGTTEDLTLGNGNLVIGQNYEIQIWHTQSGATRVMTFGDGESANTVDLIASGQFATGTFTASATSQTLSLASNGFSNCHFTAYQIRQLTGAPPVTTHTSGLLDLSGRDTTLLGAGESNGYFASPKTFDSTTDFSLNDIAWSNGSQSGTFDLNFIVTSSQAGIRRGGKGAFGTADTATGSALIDSGASLTIDSLSLSDLTGDLVGQTAANLKIIAIYLGNENGTDAATINGASAVGAAGGTTTAAMRNDITPATSAIVLGTGGDGYSLNGIDVSFDLGAPAAPAATLTTLSTSVSAPFTVDIFFTEPVTNLAEADFQIVNGTITPASLTGSDDAWSVEVTPSANGEVTVTLPAGAVDDLDGDNEQNTVSNTLELFYLAPGADQPTVTLSSSISDASAPFTIDVVFSEAVSGLLLSDFESTNATLSNLAGSGASYTILATPPALGEVTVSLPAGIATDTDGDLLTNTESNLLSVTYTTPDTPAVSIYGHLASDTPDFKVHLTFTEEVSGLTASDFQVLNGTASAIEGSGRYWSATITAAIAGNVEVTLPAGSVTDIDGDNGLNTVSNTYVTDCLADFSDRWLIDDQADWTAATGSTSNVVVADGFVEPTANSAEFSSALTTFSGKRKAKAVTFTQSPVWDNWTAIADVQPSGANDAPVFVPVGPDNYYLLARDGGNGYYAAWHSDDMTNWDYRGQVTPPTTGRWVTTAEYIDGEFYIYSDYFNDHTPRLFIDDNLDDGIPGVDMGSVLIKEASGSDNSLIRNDEDGLWHMIYEDWSPINARTHSWDSPLAGHTSSPDGINGFTENKHLPAVDLRTTPTGTFATYSHPNVPVETYEVHTPEQDAFGDWTSVKVGSRFFMFGDYDPHGQGIRLARFSSESIYEQFEFTGGMHSGHPDPTVGFAEGQFYLITQQATDYVSPGPWVEGVEARAGVDTDGDNVIDEWTTWQTITEQYDYTPNYIRVVDLTPAQVDMSSLSAGYSFQFEFRVDDTVVSGISPIMDRVEMTFEPDNFQAWSNNLGIPADENGDHNSNGLVNVIEFSIGQECLPERQADGTMVLTTPSEALSDGYTVELQFSENLTDWEPATTTSAGVKILTTTTLPSNDLQTTFQIEAPNNGTKVFWRIVVL